MKTKLEKDIAYCIDDLDLDDNQIGEMLRVCERLGNITVEYFCEEFIFECDSEEEVHRLHDDNYLKINWRLDHDK
jgi:hypothetical protein